MALWPKIPSGFVRAMLAGHSALGLFFAALLYLICLSGTAVVFQDELAEWEQPGAAATGHVPDAAAAAMLTESLARGRQTEAAEGETLHGVSAFAEWRDPGRVTARAIFDSGRTDIWLADPATGAFLEPQARPITDYLVNLHLYLRLPSPWGLYFVGFLGVAMFSLIVSGVLSHPRIFRDAFHFRRGGSRRLQEADLHNRLSVWALPFHLVVSFTGAFLGLAYLIVAVLAFVAYEGDQEAAVRAVLGPQPTEDHTAAPAPDIPALLADARGRTGLTGLNYISVDHPQTAGQLVTVELDAPDDLSSGETVFYDGAGGFIERSGSMDGSFGPQTLAALGPLHFGSYGGFWLKAAYVLFGAASTMVVVTGVTIWFARRKEQGRPAPGWERVWIGAVWGGAMGCALPALTLPFLPGSATPALLIAILAGLGAAAVVRDPARLSIVLRGALAAVLIAAAGINLALHGGAALAGPPLAINAAIAALAALLIANLLWPGAQPQTREARARP